MKKSGLIFSSSSLSWSDKKSDMIHAPRSLSHPLSYLANVKLNDKNVGCKDNSEEQWGRKSRAARERVGPKIREMMRIWK